jgi:hypothetical protein
MKGALQGIDLADSWVLGWKERSGVLEFSVEFSLWPESPHYLEPKKDEFTCYRHGILRFEGVTAIDGLRKEEAATFSTDPDGSKDFGNIQSFEDHDDSVRMSGDFGEVLVRCSSWTVDLK